MSRRSPAVHPDTREMLYVSASAIGTFLDCQRKWWMTYVLGLRSPGSEATKFGSMLHLDVERYLEGDRPAPTMALTQTAYEAGVLPEPGTVLVEHETTTLKLAGVRVKGFIDAHICNPTLIEIIDHKTMKTTRYAETSESLRRNNQMLIYAGDAMLREPGVEKATLRHIQYVRSTGEVHVVETDVSRAHVFDRLKALESVVQQMKAVAKIENIEDVPKSLGACNNYGGCYMLTVGCSGRNERSSSLPKLFPTKETPVGLLDVIKAKKAAAQTQTKAEPVAAPAAPAEYPPVDAISPPDAEPNSYTHMIDKPATALPGVTAKRVADWGVTTVGDLKAVAEAGKLSDLKGVGPKLEESIIKALTDVGMYEPKASAAPPAPAPAPPEPKAPPIAPEPKAPTEYGAQVYVDCAPLGQIDHLGAELARIYDAAVEGRSAEELDYGRHKGIFRTAYLSEVPRLKGREWFVDGYDPYYQILGDELTGLLGRVVKVRGR